MIGIDEAGRGALAGPVVAAAVILPPGFHPYRDSKTLSRAARSSLAQQLQASAVACATGWASAAEVDSLGVLRATHVAAQRALQALGQHAERAGLVTDYLELDWAGPVLSVPRADQRSFQVAAASILAKTERDAHLLELADRYPEYHFHSNAGYGTPAHRQALARHGATPEHRRSFRPVADLTRRGQPAGTPAENE